MLTCEGLRLEVAASADSSTLFSTFYVQSFLQLTAMRPRRPETNHRPPSDSYKSNRPMVPSPAPTSPTGAISVDNQVDTDDEAPPPLPEKSMHADYANVDPSRSSRISGELDERPSVARRATHRDRVSSVSREPRLFFFSTDVLFCVFFI